jgi:hypothetical protein
MLTANDIYNSPTLSDETWVSINKPIVYQRIKLLTKHMNEDVLFIDRLKFVENLIIEKKICILSLS